MVGEIAGFLIFGVIVGVHGTLVGAGGGFIIVPSMLLVYHATPQQARGTSLAVVVFNARSGPLAYARQGKIDDQPGWRCAAATAPGALIGGYV
jgi:uncharacterized membrane protein YfcA